MKTKAQKSLQIENGIADLRASKSAVIVDFTGMTANEVNALRKEVFAIGGSMSVFKKRLLKYVFEQDGAAFDAKGYAGQAGVIFAPADMVVTAGVPCKFMKRSKLLKITGGYEVESKKFLSAAETKAIGELPPKEVLLGQLVYMLGSPIRSFMCVLNERAKQI